MTTTTDAAPQPGVHGEQRRRRVALVTVAPGAPALIAPIRFPGTGDATTTTTADTAPLLRAHHGQRHRRLAPATGGLGAPAFITLVRIPDLVTP